MLTGNFERVSVLRIGAIARAYTAVLSVATHTGMWTAHVTRPVEGAAGESDEISAAVHRNPVSMDALSDVLFEPPVAMREPFSHERAMTGRIDAKAGGRLCVFLRQSPGRLTASTATTSEEVKSEYAAQRTDALRPLGHLQ